ncbi:sensor histidine kinase [Pseudoduganella buxea]|uniref:Histidine kinase n=1 Tax=Pseudoduganella buxea TaxID=1949069 RepID=A0A6I3T235_9BURK|nr:sensor histidine kinase [Pseudoduganella buxea]MTV55638.1 hypothetical protein [Pseudoduganella buxea]GGC23657.1 histidine kinase [Pseudoduganella buxea]
MALGRLVVFCMALLASCPVWAAPPPADGVTHERRRWTQADGAPQQSYKMTQDDRGLLWFSSPAGLTSFDGVRFRPEHTVFGHPLASPSVSLVMALPGGRIAVGYHFGGLDIFSRTGVQRFVAGKNFPAGSTLSLVLDRDGMLHACTTSGLVRLRQGRWETFGKESLPTGMPTAIVFDRDDTLWVSVNATYYARRSGTATFVKQLAADDQWLTTVGGVVHTVTRDRGLVRLRFGGPVEQVRMEKPATGAPALYQNGMFDGPGGSLWYQRADGVARMAPGADGVLHAVEVFPYPAGNGDAPHTGMVDREGNLWLIAYESIERYRPHRFRQVPVTKESLAWMAQRGFGDELWLGSPESPLRRMQADGTMRATEVLSPNALLRVADDHVWVGTARELWEFHGASERRIDLPAPLGTRYEIQSLARDRAGRLLVSIIRNGIWIFDADGWRQDPRMRGVPEPTPLSMLTDKAGRTWLSLVNERFGELTQDGFRLLPANVGMQVGTGTAMLDVAGRVLLGGDRGVAWLRGDRAVPMRLAGDDAVGRVSGMAVDGTGSLWLHGDKGLYRLTAAQLQRFWQAPDQPVDAELFNFEDGVRGLPAQVRPLPSLAVAHGGRLYYATMSQVGWIDAASIQRNPRPPGVLVQSLYAAGRAYDAADGLVLPERTTAVDIAFTATALSVPERVKLKYRLDGVDGDWRDARRERGAQYTNLAPGRYRFHVIAANEDGVWNRTGAGFAFEIRPAFWQTWWFRLACAAALLLLLAQMYRWRMAVVRRRAEERTAARLDATMQERNRIARSLHDNLLQAVQALILRFHMVQTRLPKEPELQAMLDKVLGYAEKLVAHARDEVLALRQAPPCAELLDELRGALEKAAPGADGLLDFETKGTPRPLHNDTAVELLYVLREAVVNSARHAGGTRITVRLHFGDDMLEGEVADDGIGIDPVIAATGRAGHWGLAGMRERMARVGGTLAVGPGDGAGVLVRFAIPAGRAYGG